MQVTVEVNDITFVLIGEYSPADPGRYSGPPENCYPAEGANFDLESVKVSGFEVPDALLDSLHVGRWHSADGKADFLAGDTLRDALVEAALDAILSSGAPE